MVVDFFNVMSFVLTFIFLVDLYGFQRGLFAVCVLTSVCTAIFSTGGFFEEDSSIFTSVTVEDDNIFLSLLVILF